MYLVVSCITSCKYPIRTSPKSLGFSSEREVPKHAFSVEFCVFFILFAITLLHTPSIPANTLSLVRTNSLMSPKLVLHALVAQGFDVWGQNQVQLQDMSIQGLDTALCGWTTSHACSKGYLIFQSVNFIELMLSCFTVWSNCNSSYPWITFLLGWDFWFCEWYFFLLNNNQ